MITSMLNWDDQSLVSCGVGRAEQVLPRLGCAQACHRATVAQRSRTQLTLVVLPGKQSAPTGWATDTVSLFRRGL